jgi:N-acyl-D-aspartate/D-glutamate deacylase
MADGFDLVIRDGLVVDGSGGDPVEADVAVIGGKIAAIGKGLARGADEIDASGKLVTPGFVDVHTHYDAQVAWGHQITPSSWNGVTTAVIGNCGVGFAPCRPDQREMLVKLMEGVEDLPEAVMTAGLPWEWESFPQFLDFLGGRSFDLDVVAQLPHAALRVFVMGQRAADLEPATAQDCAAMAKIAGEAVRAGALGFTTSRTLAHKTKAGEHTPTVRAEEAELSAIAAATGEAGAAWMQVISDFDPLVEEFGMLRRVAQALGKPMTISMLQREWKSEEWRKLLDLIDEANDEGIRIIGQTMGRPVGLILGFELSFNPFSARPSWAEIADLPLDAKMARLTDPAFRARLLAEETDPAMAMTLNRWDRLYPMTLPLDYEPAPENSLAALAARQGVEPQVLAYDLMLQNGGKTVLSRPVTNYADGDLSAVHDMMINPNTILGLSDGGAHLGVICDASAPTTTLLHWARDRTRGPKMSLPWVVRRLTRDCAEAIGMHDRGLIARGLKADLNVIDFDHLAVSVPEMVYDLPAGGRRLIQRTQGYDATILSGVAVARDGAATGDLPGRLVRAAH